MINLILVLFFTHISPGWAMSVSSEFLKADGASSVTNYQHLKLDIEISAMDSEFEYSDLGPESIKELDALTATKKEYGVMFGFKEWTPGEKKLISFKSDRIFVLQGTYKDSQNKKVNFLEVYWASKTQSKQYLITSSSVVLGVDNYKEYLKL